MIYLVLVLVCLTLVAVLLWVLAQSQQPQNGLVLSEPIEPKESDDE